MLRHTCNLSQTFEHNESPASRAQHNPVHLPALPISLNRIPLGLGRTKNPDTHITSDTEAIVMVLLTMTASIVDGLTKLDGLQGPKDSQKSIQNEGQRKEDDDPSLDEPTIGNPITHGQIIDIWKKLQASQQTSYSLEELLRGSQVYIPPPPPKPEPVGYRKTIFIARIC